MRTLLTLQEAANALRFSRSKIYWERRSGRLRTLRFGRLVRVAPEEIARFIAETVDREKDHDDTIRARNN